MRKLNYQDLEDIIYGCTILGTGGGGDLNEGISAVKDALSKNKKFKMLNFNEIEDDSYYINPYFCGSISPESEEEKEPNPELIYAVQGLEKYMDVNFHGIVSIEYGGGNTGQCMATAAMLDKYIVDGDAAGRAVPELQFSTYYVTEKPIYPFCVATKYEDIAIFTKVASDERAEALSRMMAVATDNIVGMADHPINGANLKNAVIPDALSYAEKIGKARREAVEKGNDPIEAILKEGKGKLLAKGVVNSKNTYWEIKDGFTTGEIGITGLEDFKDNEYRIWYRNENMIIWENEEVKLTCPDLICVLDLEDGYPITNPNCTDGRKVAVLAFEAHPLWKTERGLSILNPKFFGFDNVDIVDISSL
jgi:DUF917 family protein